jgi:hypothetical protein
MKEGRRKKETLLIVTKSLLVLSLVKEDAGLSQHGGDVLAGLLKHSVELVECIVQLSLVQQQHT